MPYKYRTDADRALLAQLGVVPSSKVTSTGQVPRVHWVAKGGYDGGNNGTFDDPFLTVQYAVDQATSGRGDIIAVGPGEYAEVVNVNKLDLWITGTGGRHPGRTQIVGTTSQTAATLLVDAGYLRGFRLSNISLDTGGSSASAAPTGVAQPCLHLVTSDANNYLSATSTDEWAWLDNIHINSGNSTPPSIGILLAGATAVLGYNCRVSGVTRGIVVRPDAAGNNVPTDVRFEDFDFSDNTTYDIGTQDSTGTDGGPGGNVVNVWFVRPRFWDRGGTPVTNYVNYSAISTAYVNCGFLDFFAMRDVADDTLMALPPNVVAIGTSAAGAEAIIGS